MPVFFRGDPSGRPIQQNPLMYHQLPIESLTTLVHTHHDCIVLDTARPSAEQRHSFVFVNPKQVFVCDTIERIPAFLESITEQSKNKWLAGYLSYEASYGLEKRFYKFIKRPNKNELAWFGVFPDPFIFDHQSGKWNREPEPALDKKDPSSNDESINIHQTTTYEKYARSIKKIRKLIAAGDIYQVNFTYDLSVSSSLRAWDLYIQLRDKQPVPFGAFIKTGTTTIASFSPELFFMKQGRHITTRPMKGTARRGRYNDEDKKRSASLAADPKNCSENVMIVDLLRNNIGKICKTGTVKTTSLFKVERYPTVLQMTSTVEGVLEKADSLSSIFRALFPCGSVTGAPKIRAMEIIHALETGERGVYCGAIGYSSPTGNAVFSVPIRTLQKKNGANQWRYRVGSGIVWDSSSKEEWRECRDKCRFLTINNPDFALFESILFDKRTLVFCEEHKKRLFDAADYFGFGWSEKEWTASTGSIVAELKKRKSKQKVRILLDKAGALKWESEPIVPSVKNEKQRAIMAEKPIDTETPFLFHKTTIRPWYRGALKSIHAGKCFDIIHYNREGQVTEGARSNIFLKINDQLYTPPVGCGLLPGILRGRMLKAGKCKERILKIEDLSKAEKVYCGNSVRGLVEVNVEGEKNKFK